MSISARRAQIATTITANLNSVKVAAYKPNSPKPFTGWLEISQVDLEDATYGEVRLTLECLILVAANRSDFEKAMDSLAIDLVSAVTASGGRGTVITPFTETIGNTTIYALSARFVTETEA